MSKLEGLAEAGQSIWYDFIRRDMLEDGRLAALVASGVRGVTSNPSIFQKAIAGGHEYDDSIKHHLEAGLAGEDLFFELAIEDLRRACDLFAPIHAATGGQDGW